MDAYGDGQYFEVYDTVANLRTAEKGQITHRLTGAT